MSKDTSSFEVTFFYYAKFQKDWTTFTYIRHFTMVPKGLRGTYVRRMTAATAAITLAFLFVEMLCYVLGRLHSSCVLSTKIVLHR